VFAKAFKSLFADYGVAVMLWEPPYEENKENVI
jgi:hypothetical protein